MLADEPFTSYLEALSDGNPSPGGGSVAALNGALAAALVCMVGNLTLADHSYEDVHSEVSEILSSMEKARGRLVELAQEDARVTSWLIPIIHELKVSTGGARDELHREAQAGLVSAARTPLSVLELCCQVLAAGQRVAEIGTGVALSDTGMAVAAAQAGIEGAALTVRINLGMIEDAAFVQMAAERVAELSTGRRELCAAVLSSLHRRL